MSHRKSHCTVRKCLMSNTKECREETDFARGLDMERSMRLVPTNRVSTGNAETMSAMEKLRDHRYSVQEETMQQCNVKVWKATHFRSETECLLVSEQKSSRSHQNSDWRRLAGVESLSIEQLDSFEKDLENSMATLEERLEQSRRAGCRGT